MIEVLYLHVRLCAIVYLLPEYKYSELFTVLGVDGKIVTNFPDLRIAGVWDKQEKTVK